MKESEYSEKILQRNDTADRVVIVGGWMVMLRVPQIPIPTYQYRYTNIPIPIYRYRYTDIKIPIYQYQHTDTDTDIPIYRYTDIPIYREPVNSSPIGMCVRSYVHNI